MDAPSFNGSDDRDEGCSGDQDACECPLCRAWRESRYQRERTFDEQLGSVCEFQEQQAAAQRIKR